MGNRIRFISKMYIMSKYSRYEFIKRKHQNTIILLLEKGKYITFKEDKKLFQYFDCHIKVLEEYQINYIILENVTIVKQKEYQENNYEKYFKLLKLQTITSLLLESVMYE